MSAKIDHMQQIQTMVDRSTVQQLKEIEERLKAVERRTAPPPHS
jgi:hypothetical protein